MRIFMMALSLALGTSFMTENPAFAGERGWSKHHRSYAYRGGPRVRGYVSRRGGYSYSYEDSINTYGDSRGQYGSARSFRDPSLDRQSQGGPFDHGFFFDSGIAPRGGDSPYMH